MSSIEWLVVVTCPILFGALLAYYIRGRRWRYNRLSATEQLRGFAVLFHVCLGLPTVLVCQYIVGIDRLAATPGVQIAVLILGWSDVVLGIFTIGAGLVAHRPERSFAGIMVLLFALSLACFPMSELLSLWMGVAGLLIGFSSQVTSAIAEEYKRS